MSNETALPERTRVAQRVRLGVALAATYAASLAVGFAVGYTVYYSIEPNTSSDEPFAGLAEALISVGIGGLAALVMYSVLGVMLARRFAPDGTRRYVLLAYFGGPFVALAAGSVALEFTPSALFVLALPPLLVFVAAKLLSWKPVVIMIAIAVSLGVVFSLRSAVDEQRQRDNEVLKWNGPVALTNGNSTRSPFPGWKLLRGAGNGTYNEVYGSVSMQWRKVNPDKSEDNYVVEFYKRTGEAEGLCKPSEYWPPCKVVGQVTEGPVVRSSRSQQIYFVDVPKGRWQVTDAPSQNFDIQELFDSLDPVSITKFNSAVTP